MPSTKTEWSQKCLQAASPAPRQPKGMQWGLLTIPIASPQLCLPPPPRICTSFSLCSSLPEQGTQERCEDIPLPSDFHETAHSEGSQATAWLWHAGAIHASGLALRSTTGSGVLFTAKLLTTFEVIYPYSPHSSHRSTVNEGAGEEPHLVPVQHLQ